MKFCLSIYLLCLFLFFSAQTISSEPKKTQSLVKFSSLENTHTRCKPHKQKYYAVTKLQNLLRDSTLVELFVYQILLLVITTSVFYLTINQ